MRDSQAIEQVLSRILSHCGPALEGVKVSSLVNFKSLHEKWQTYKNQVKDYISLEYYELKIASDHTLVLFYNPDLLEETLKREDHQVFLNRFGYDDFNVSQALDQLARRFSLFCPHEMGIFLGYPLEDVACFASCDQKNCLATGYWKVYTNLDQAKATFKLYDQIKSKISTLLSQGYLPSTILKEAMN
jgi:hypothetical protein